MRRTREKLISSFEQAGQAAADGLSEAATNFRRGLATTLADMPLAGSAALPAAAGRNPAMDAAMAKFGAAGLKGNATEIGNWSIRDRQGFWSRLAERDLADLDAQARTGAVGVGMTPDQIDLLAALRPNDRQIQAAKADAISRQLLPAQAAILDDANAQLSARPSDPLVIRDAAAATETYAKLAAQLRDLNDATGELGPAFRQFADTARSAIESGLGDALTRLVEGSGSVREAFASMASPIFGDFLRLQSHLIVEGIVGDLGRIQSIGQSGGLGGLLGQLIGSFAGGAGGAGAAVGAASGAAAGAVAFADGGVL